MADSAEVLASGSSPSGRQLASHLPSATDERGEVFLFLCPNGHKLHGRRRLAGKVGQCPRCGAKFEIPFPYESDDEEPGLDDTVTEDPLRDFDDEGPGIAPDANTDSLSEAEVLFEVVPTDADSSATSRVEAQSGKQASGASLPIPPPLPASAASWSSGRKAHALADLVSRLWSEREHGGVIELHLKGGAMLVPDWFDQAHSKSTHGLFAAQAADGTLTMTVVPWDEVTRVVVRGVVGLPDGLFE